MALITRPPVQSKLKWCKTSDSGSLSHSKSPKLVLTSCQYPVLDPGAADMDMSQSTSYSTTSVSGVPPTSSSEQPASAAPAGEKKRNKLGYHRTSLACNHCRRRKIRCIASPDDQNRCVNCIRLKKECSFYPVDQQPPPDARLPSQAPGGSHVPSASSSPAISSGSPAELASHHQHPYSPMAVIPIPSMGTPTVQSTGNEYFPPEAKVPSNRLPQGIPYNMGDQPAANWTTPDTSSNSIAKAGNQNIAWRSYTAESPMGGQFSPYSHASTASTSWVSSNHEQGDVMGWGNISHPPRPISSTGELIGGQPTSQYFAMAQNRPYERQPGNYSDVYSPSMDVSLAGMDASAGQVINPTGSLIGGVVPSPTPVSWQHQLMSQPQQQQHQMPYPKRGDEYGDWGYGDGGGTHHM